MPACCPSTSGVIPTPALTYYALGRGKASIMVTGSHIPFDRNGYKLNTSQGELLKQHEAPINQRVRQVRESACTASASDRVAVRRTRRISEVGHRALPDETRTTPAAPTSPGTPISSPAQRSAGMRLLAYQHSAVGRDLLVEILERLGAVAISGGPQRHLRPHRH